MAASVSSSTHAASSTTSGTKRRFDDTPSRAKVSKQEDTFIYIHAETTGLDPATQKTIEIGIAVFNHEQNQQLAQYTSTVKLSAQEWSACIQNRPRNDKTKRGENNGEKIHGLTFDKLQSGKTAAIVAAEIFHKINQLHLPRDTKIVTHNEKFEKPFVAQVWPQSRQYKWVDISKMYDPNRTCVKRDEMAKEMKMSITPMPHSALTVAKHIAAMHFKLLYPNAAPQILLAPSYAGDVRQRDMQNLLPATAQDLLFSHLPNEIEELERGTQDWERWHKEGLGSTDAPAALGLIPFWKTAFQLWEEKTGKVQEPPPNEAMQRGLDLEGAARNDFEKFMGMEVRPICLQHPQMKWLRVSINGISKSNNVIMDCVVPKDENYAAYRNGRLDKYYLYKIQTQLMMCPTAEYAICWVWHPEHGGLPFYITPDKAMQTEILTGLKAFRRMVENNQPPEKVGFDFGHNELAKRRELVQAALPMEQPTASQLLRDLDSNDADDAYPEVTPWQPPLDSQEYPRYPLGGHAQLPLGESQPEEQPVPAAQAVEEAPAPAAQQVNDQPAADAQPSDGVEAAPPSPEARSCCDWLFRRG